MINELGDKSEAVLAAIDADDAAKIKAAVPSTLSKSSVGALLLVSVWRGSLNAVRYLLNDRKANPNATDPLGRSGLHLAAINGRIKISEVLLAAGAAVDCFDKHHLATPLFCAAVADSPAGIRLLLDRGADINAGLSEYGVSALHCAVRANNIDNVRVLLELGAVPNSVQLFSETPLHTAASMGYEDCTKLLVEHGACLEVLMGSMKMTALHLAAQDGNMESVQCLVSGGANIDARNARGQSALHLAALAQSPETVEVLLKSGKNLVLPFRFRLRDCLKSGVGVDGRFGTRD